MPSGRNHIIGIRTIYDPKQDRGYNRFRSEYLKPLGKLIYSQMKQGNSGIMYLPQELLFQLENKYERHI